MGDKGARTAQKEHRTGRERPRGFPETRRTEDLSVNFLSYETRSDRENKWHHRRTSQCSVPGRTECVTSHPSNGELQVLRCGGRGVHGWERCQSQTF